MGKILLLVMCLCIGYMLKRYKVVPKDAHLTLNSLIIYVFVPAITFRYGFELELKTEQLLPALSAWIVFFGSWFFFTGISKIVNLDQNTLGALIVTAGISSISFVGFPIFELLYGAEGLKYGIVLSQAGTFFVCSTIGVLTATAYAKNSVNVKWREVIKNNLTFPPFLSFCIVIGLKVLGFRPNQHAMQFFEVLCSPLSIIALITIGMQVSFSGFKNQYQALFSGLLYKLVIAPLLVFFVFFILLKSTGVAAKVSVIGSAIGSMNTMGIIAIKKGLNPELVSILLAISIPISLILIPLIYFLIEYFY